MARYFKRLGHKLTQIFLFVLVVSLLLFFILYFLERTRQSLCFQWLILIIWLIFTAVLKKIMFKEKKIIATEIDDEDEEDDDEDEDEDEDDEEDGDEY